VQIINTVKPGYFQQEITKALKERKEKQALTQNKYITMNDEMLKLITSSNHVSTGKCTPFTHPPCSDPRQGSKSPAEDFEEEDARADGGSIPARRHRSDLGESNKRWTKRLHASAEHILLERSAETAEDYGAATVQPVELTPGCSVTLTLSINTSSLKPPFRVRAPIGPLIVLP
jgi:hypothetical protein